MVSKAGLQPSKKMRRGLPPPEEAAGGPAFRQVPAPRREVWQQHPVQREPGSA